MRKRTRNQAYADIMDMNIHRFWRSAQEHAEGISGATMKDRKIWETVSAKLGNVRTELRRMMHEDDRYETSR